MQRTECNASFLVGCGHCATHSAIFCTKLQQCLIWVKRPSRYCLPVAATTQIGPLPGCLLLPKDPPGRGVYPCCPPIDARRPHPSQTAKVSLWSFLQGRRMEGEREGAVKNSRPHRTEGSTYLSSSPLSLSSSLVLFSPSLPPFWLLPSGCPSPRWQPCRTSTDKSIHQELEKGKKKRIKTETRVAKRGKKRKKSAVKHNHQRSCRRRGGKQIKLA